MAVEYHVLEPAIDESESDSFPHLTSGGSNKSSLPPRKILLAIGATAVVTCILTVLMAVPLTLALGERQVSSAADASSVWSPLLDIIEYEDRDFDNAFDHQTIYRGPPTKDVEQAWEELTAGGLDRGLSLPASKMAAINRSLDMDLRDWVPVSADRGPGFYATIDVFHQLHCLNMIRQFTWLEFYERHTDRLEMPPSLQDSPVGRRMHVDHCIEALRITLMCHGDVTPLLTEWDPSESFGVRADFNAHHRCRKWEPIHNYMKQHAFSGVCAGAPGEARAKICP